jgi:putative aldouronate transport system permease protein
VVGGENMITKKTLGEKVFDTINYSLLFVFGLICVYPMLYVIFASFSDPILLMNHDGGLIKPLGFSLEGYKVVFNNPNIISGYGNTIFYVVVGTTVNLFLTSMGAYVLSRKNLLWKKPLMLMIVFTMYFGGGLIPNYMLVRALGLYNTRWALIIPGAIGTWNLVVMKTAFSAIPDSLEESARIEGANDFVILFRIILPVVKATIAVMMLFYAVGHWNAWFGAMIYLRNRSLYPLQLFLREILIYSSSGGNTAAEASYDDTRAFIELLIKYCTIVVSTVPILFIYPFAQKYFVKGAMLGSLKE